MKVACDTPGCGHVWDYEGKSKYYAKCSMCLSFTKLNKELVK